MTSLAIGCPLRDRAWMMPAWCERLHFATAGFEKIKLVVVGDEPHDQKTFTVLRKEASRWGFQVSYVYVPEDLGPYERDWSLERYGHMSMLRNKLLERVRDLKPDLFWSVDSDILVAEMALRSAIEGLERFDAIGSKTFMTPHGTWCPSFGMLNGGGLNRWDDTGFFPVDVIMALKLMTPKAYQVNYALHEQGEDIGWSLNAHNFGVKLGWDGSTVSKHVMTQDALAVVDERCGF